MATKPVINSVSTNSRINSAALNSALNTLADGVAGCVSRLGTGSTNNSFTGTLDMDGNRIQNMGAPISSGDAVSVAYLSGILSDTNAAGFVVIVEEYVATAGQTIFPLVASYIPAYNNIIVFQNGLRLLSSVYTETDANTITLNSGATVGDKIAFIINQPVTTTDPLNIPAGDTLIAAVAAAQNSAVGAGLSESAANQAALDAQGFAGDAEDARDDAVIAKNQAIAAAGSVKVSADDTTGGYLETKLILASNSGLVLATTSPGGDERRTVGIGLDTNPGLVLGAGGLKVDLGTDPGLEFSADGLEVKVKAGGGITKDADGLSLASSGGMWEKVGNTITISAVSSVDWTSLDGATYDYALKLDAVIPATVSGKLKLLAGYGATPTYTASAYTQGIVTSNNAATPTNAAVGGTFTGYYIDNATYTYSGTVEVFSDGAENVYANWHGHDGALGSTIIGGGANYNTSKITALRLIMSAGNLTSGKVSLYRRTI